MAADVELRKCSTCSKELPLTKDNFVWYYKGNCLGKQCKDCDRANQRAWQRRNYSRCNQQNKEQRFRLRLKVLKHYGGNPPKCACCGESGVEFLAVDHIEGGGWKHRNAIQIYRSSTNFYRWLVKNDYPPGYQVLCHNCNQGKGAGKACPHQKQENYCMEFVSGC